MAKPPRVGSKLKISDFVQKKITSGTILKAIQPQVLSYFDERFHWVIRLIAVRAPHETVGIARKYEAGYAIIEEKDNGKLKLISKNIAKEFRDGTKVEEKDSKDSE